MCHLGKHILHKREWSCKRFWHHDWNITRGQLHLQSRLQNSGAEHVAKFVLSWSRWDLERTSETRRCALKVFMDGLPKTIDKDILEVWDALNNLWPQKKVLVVYIR
ncbi:hypothetical protein CMV_016770 [Castanea mollissima]|uniref:Uncharacterized protein n=1 Tax=Castanea mollissima TaxID=60419 RepID=A0A8J4VEF6_9ROSI|nr:hypothetical protein CMV_016770 [Castanea mollissima]